MDRSVPATSDRLVRQTSASSRLARDLDDKICPKSRTGLSRTRLCSYLRAPSRMPKLWEQDNWHTARFQANLILRLMRSLTFLQNQRAPQRGARILLSQMGTLPWQVIRGAHRSPDDPSLHVTIAIAATRYHLRLDARSCVFDITVVGNKTHRLAGRKPWAGPGA